jgi:uncharacterized DUF497 family protein
MLPSMKPIREFFPQIITFEWGEGNSDKNWHRHWVSRAEAEQVFLNRPLLAADDPLHSDDETRYFALGHTDAGRCLAVVFTLRGPRLGVISARAMSRRERRFYAQAEAAEGDPEL